LFIENIFLFSICFSLEMSCFCKHEFVFYCKNIIGKKAIHLALNLFFAFEAVIPELCEYIRH